MAHTQPASPSVSPPPSAAGTPPPRKPDILRGWIKTARDAMLVLEATRAGVVPRVTRRFHEAEKRSIIQSGAVFVFTEEESGIKRWTDPYLWTASRMQGCFLMYREREDTRTERETSPFRCSGVAPPDSNEAKMDKELEHYILGSWNTGKGLKKDGLMKKTISISIEDTTYHLVSYYYPSDIRSGLLQTPSSMPEFASLEISTATKIGFSQTRSLQVGRGKRGRPSRSQIKKEPSDCDSEESIPPPTRTTPIYPIDVVPSRARALARHPSLTPSVATSSSRSSSPRTRYRPYPKLATQYSPNSMPPPLPTPGPHNYSASPISRTSPTPTTYEHTPSPCDTSPPCPVWQASPPVHPSPVLPVYDLPYPPAAYYPGIAVEPCDPTYHQQQMGTYDPDAQQRFIRSWEPVMDETRVMMAGQRPVPQVLSYEGYYTTASVDPSGYY